MKDCIWSSPSMNEKFEIRSVWSTIEDKSKDLSSFFVFD